MKSYALSLIVALGLALPVEADPNASFDRFDFSAAHRATPIAGGIWSPVGRPTYVAEIGGNAVFEPVRAYIGAALPEERHPLVVMSHGSGSSMDGMAWLGAGLAARGALVVVLNHPGTTTGDSSPRRTVRLAERGADLSAVLDHVLADPDLADRIDTDRIAALGFSLGGSAVLGLAGQRLDPIAYARYCAKEGNAAQDCHFLAKGGVNLDRLPHAFSADFSDPRFTRIVAVDPGFTFGAVRESVEQISVPVQLVSLGDGFPWRAVDVRGSGSGLVEMIAEVSHAVIPDAHHFSFLPICTEVAAALLVEEGEDPICTDPEGSDRAVVHAQALEAIADFLDLPQ